MITQTTFMEPERITSDVPNIVRKYMLIPRYKAV